MLYNDFLNSLVEKITAHYGTMYLVVSQANTVGRVNARKF